MKRVALIFLSILLLSPSAGAQFYLSGNEPASQKWNQVLTRNFRVIYPAGLDSLAAAYAGTLENCRPKVGASTLYAPNDACRRPMPVILHTNTALSNGMVTWTPRRMDLYTTPDPYSPGPVPWIQDLVIHESRHTAQMQLGRARPYRFYNILTGQLFAGAMAALYSGQALLEGDAVTAETALTAGGRGRSADFFEFYRTSFLNGEFRDWYQWRWGTDGTYTPDHYLLGYVTVAGIRTFYDFPDFTEKYYANISGSRWPHFPMFVLQKTVREASGKNLKKSFRDIADSLAEGWRREDSLRAPFMPGDRLTGFTDFHKSISDFDNFRELTGGTTDGRDLYYIRKGIAFSPSVVRVGSDGKMHFVSRLGSYTSPLRAGENGIYWSEYVPDERWEMASTSRIRCLRDGLVRDLTSDGRLFNPAPSGNTVAAVEFLREGGCGIRVTDAADGRELSFIKAPEGLQLSELAWLDGRLYAIAVTPDRGTGIFDVDAGFQEVLAPHFSFISQLATHEGRLVFLCDRSGVKELYSLDPDDGGLCQLTNTRGGLSDCVFFGDSLYYSVLSPTGRDLYRTALDDLPVRQVPTDGRHEWLMAELLSLQEDSLLHSKGIHALTLDAPSITPYRKSSHLLHIHSWAPLWFDYDRVAALSFERLSETAYPGAMVFFQNELSSFSGYAGVTLKGDAHIKATWSGLYPILEASADFIGRRPVSYSAASVIGKDGVSRHLFGTYPDGRSISGKMRAYIPFNFSSGGWNRGVVPQLSYSVSSDRFNSSELVYHGPAAMGDSPEILMLRSVIPGDAFPFQKLSASVRGYSALPVPDACVFPRLGMGGEVGFSSRPGTAGSFTPAAYAYLYGYLPGLNRRDGVRLSVMSQKMFTSGRTAYSEPAVTTLPEGFSFIHYQDLYRDFPVQTRLSAEYLFTDCFGGTFSNLSFAGPLAYVRRFDLDISYELTLLSGNGCSGSLGCLDTSFYAVLGNILWIPYETRLGVRVRALSENTFSDRQEYFQGRKNSVVSLLFEVDF